MKTAAVLVVLAGLVAFVYAVGEVNEILEKQLEKRDLENLQRIANGDKELLEDPVFRAEAGKTLKRIKRASKSMTPEDYQKLRLSIAKYTGPQGAKKIMTFTKMLKKK